MKKIKKSIYFFVIASMASAFLLGNFTSSKIASATEQDACNQEFIYTKSSDFNDNRVSINFESNDNQIDVSAKNGYEVTKVELDVSNDNKSGYYTYATTSVNNFNPNPGTDINSAKITLIKVCQKVNICHFTSSQSNPVEAIRVDEDAFDGQGNNDHTLHGDFLYNGPVNPQNQQPIKPDGDEWCENNNPNISVTPTKTPSATPTLRPTITPSVTPTLTPYPSIQPSVTPTPTDEPRVTPTVTPTIEVTPTPTTEITVTLTPTYEPSTTPTPTTGQGGICDENEYFDNGLQICIQCDGGGTCEVTNVTPTVTPEPIVTIVPTSTVTPTPTNTPSQGGTSDNNSSSNSSSNNSESKNEVASVNAYANTGAFQETLSNAMLSIGAAFTALSSALYGKKKKTNKK